MQAAIALQSSLTEVKWSFCSFSGKSNIGVTAWAISECMCVIARPIGREGRDCAHIIGIRLSLNTRVHVSVGVYMYLHSVCMHIT